MTFLVKQTLDFGQETALESIGLPLASALHSQTTDSPQILNGSVTVIFSGVPSLRREPCERDQNLTLQPIFRRANSSLPDLAAAQPFSSRHNADSLNRSPQRQSNHRVTGFVIGRGFVAQTNSRQFHWKVYYSSID